jgi:hypothetical protein
MDNIWRIKLATGEAQSAVAEAWFTYLGFLTLTAILHAVADKSGIPGFVAFKWICYLALWRWVMYKTDRTIWIMFPTADPAKNKKIKWRVLFWSVFISTNVVGFSYFISRKAVQLIGSIGAT